MKNHALFSPSARHRWSKCPASLNYQEYKESVYAKEGTLAHDLLEKFLTRQKAKKSEGYTDEMINIVKDTYTRIEDNLQINMQNSTDIKVEELVGNVEKNIFGTVDLRFTIDIEIDGVIKTIRVIYDFKYGKGVLVEAKDNKQLLTYAVLDYEEFKKENQQTIIDEYWLVIDQPRLNHFDYSIYKTSKIEEEKITLVEEMKTYLTMDEEVFVAGGHCKFCTHKKNCNEYFNYNKDSALSVLDDVPVTIDDKLEVYKKVFLNKKKIIEFLTFAENQLYKQIEEGNIVQGLKVVRGRSNRVWSDETEVVKKIVAEGKQAYEPKLKSVSKVEKELGKKRFNEILGSHVQKTQGKLTLVSSEDKREAIDVRNNVAILDDEI